MGVGGEMGAGDEGGDGGGGELWYMGRGAGQEQMPGWLQADSR